MPQTIPLSQAIWLLAISPRCAMRINGHGRAAHCDAGKPLNLGLATCCSQGLERRRPNDFAIITVGHHDTAAIGAIVLSIKDIPVDLRRKPPIESIAEVEVIGPFAIAEQIAALDLNFDDDDPALRIETHQISAPSVAQWHFRHQPDIIPGEQALDAAADAASIEWGVENRGIAHGDQMEQKANAVKRVYLYSGGARARTAARAV